MIRISSHYLPMLRVGLGRAYHQHKDTLFASQPTNEVIRTTATPARWPDMVMASMFFFYSSNLHIQAVLRCTLD